MVYQDGLGWKENKEEVLDGEGFGETLSVSRPVFDGDGELLIVELLIGGICVLDGDSDGLGELLTGP